MGVSAGGSAKGEAGGGWSVCDNQLKVVVVLKEATPSLVRPLFCSDRLLVPRNGP